MNREHSPEPRTPAESRAQAALEPRRLSFQAGEPLAGLRLDAAIAQLAPETSRSQVRRWIDAGRVRVDGRPGRAAQRLRGGERIEAEAEEPRPLELRAEPIELAIVHEDGDLIVIDKRADMVVHPAPGHASGTLVHALLHHCHDLSGIGGALRPGIVHRLDRGTSGLLVVAKNDATHRALAEQFRVHAVERQYLALVRGVPQADAGEIDAAIGRGRDDRKRFTTRAPARARRAVTRWGVEQRFADFALLRVWPQTGRTHQIRVHLAAAGLPIAGDPLYGGGKRSGQALGLERQALHSAAMAFLHPREQRRLCFESPLPEDLARAVSALRR